jgi:hypothetical protein
MKGNKWKNQVSNKIIFYYSVSEETRRRLLWSLFQQLIDKNEDFFGNDKRIFNYDCGQLLYCTKDLGLKEGSVAREFTLEYDPVSSINKEA